MAEKAKTTKKSTETKSSKSQEEKTGLGITSLVFGVISFCLCWVPFLGFLCGIVGLVLAIIFLTKKPTQKVYPIVGICTSGVGILVGAIFSLILIMVLCVGSATYDSGINFIDAFIEYAEKSNQNEKPELDFEIDDFNYNEYFDDEEDFDADETIDSFLDEELLTDEEIKEKLKLTDEEKACLAKKGIIAESQDELDVDGIRAYLDCYYK